MNLSYQLDISVKVKNELISEQVEKIKSVLETFDTNNPQDFICLEMAVDYMQLLRAQRSEIYQFVEFVNKTHDLSVFPSDDF